MGEYFKWVNPKKREWIDDESFGDYGFMFSVASTLGNRYTDAACTLLAGPWRGDPVMYVGDYYTPEEGSEIAGLFDGRPYEDALDNFRDVRGLFRCAEGKLSPIWEEGDDLDGDDVPYAGSFDTEVSHYRYAFDKTRGELVNRDAGPVKIVAFHNGEYSWNRLDPLVVLLTPRKNPSEWEGRWCCDEVEMLDELPASEYRDVTRCVRPGWGGHLLFATDEEMAALTASDEFARAREECGITPSSGSLSLPGAVEALLDIAAMKRGAS